MTNPLNSSYFGILLSLIAYEIGLIAYRKTKLSLFNPLLVSIFICIGFLGISHIDYGFYNQGGSIISLFQGPATVILAVPLYKNLDLLKQNLLPILMGVVVGSVTVITSIILLSRLFGLSAILQASLIPKSITTPIGIELSKQIGGNPSITVLAILITGIFGAVSGPFILNLFRINDEVALGIALGTASHAIGTTKAIELGEVQGGMSGLAIGLAGLTTVLLVTMFL